MIEKQTIQMHRATLGGQLRSVCGAALLALASLCSTAEAQDRNVAAAADAFSKAQQAELRGEFEAAVNLYELADQLAPTVEALRSAARSARKGGMNAMAANYAADLLAREPVDATSRALAEEILSSTTAELVRMHITCDQPCKVLVDGRIASRQSVADHTLYSKAGTRKLSASFGSGTTPEQTLPLSAGTMVELTFTAPVVVAPLDLDSQAAEVAAAEPQKVDSAETRDGHKLSPWYFGTAGALTVVAGGLTVWSALEVKSAHKDYDRGAADAESDYRDGRKLEKQTNALIGVTSGIAAVTVTLAFFTDFKRDKAADKQRAARIGTPNFTASRQGAWLGYTRTF